MKKISIIVFVLAALLIMSALLIIIGRQQVLYFRDKIENVQSANNALQDRIDHLESDLESATGGFYLDEISSRVDDIEVRLDENESELENMKSDIDDVYYYCEDIDSRLSDLE